jgi:hypothetical protein
MSDTPLSLPLERLEHSRARLRQWLEHDRTSPDASPLGETVRNTLPFLNAVWGHPATAMMLGAVAKSWCRTDPEAPTAEGESAPLTLAVDLVKQHPKTAVLAVGVAGVAAAYWFSRQRHTHTGD